jgi:F1F0 ATPase subunit 2
MSSLIVSLFCGLLLGGFFFCGLAWTIAKGLHARRPALIFVLSYFVRLGVVVGGFMLVASGQAERVLASLVGFVVARLVVTRWIRGGSVCT